MDDAVISMILRGCELARRLEASLPSMAVASLTESCGEIIRAFAAAREKLSGYQQASAFDNREEWLMRSGYGRGIIMDQHVMMQSHDDERDLHVNMEAGQGASRVPDQPAAVAGPSASRAAVGGSGSFQAGQHVSRSSTSRPRRNERRDGRRTVRVAAPRIGNTEIPPEDGFTWRKYGQKEILGSRFPRAYFRCTHQKLYHCPAKKQVQRLDDDPDTFQVTYRSDHTCHLSATAPGPPPNSSLALPPAIISQQQHSIAPTASARAAWLSMGIGCGGSRPTSDPRAHSYDGYSYQPVIDMADTMFNSGSSGTPCMDQIFSSAVEDVEWDQVGDLKGKKHR
uniref:WRKY domain-containing protein n=1 Tax=Kalanchoe fedtschenkoi TaxID=63787 RepID=A0A7N0UFB5_KALFE